MARAILLGGSVAWLLAACGGLGLAWLGTDALERALPPLAIDTDALRGAIVAVAAGSLILAAIHAFVLLVLRRRAQRALSAAILLATVMATLFVVLAVAAVTSAVAEPTLAVSLLGGAFGAAVVAVAYGLAVARLVSEVRAGSRG